MKLGALLGLAALATSWPLSAGAQPWQNAALPPVQRAKLLVAAMTQDEELATVHGTGAYVGHVPGIPRLGIPDLNLEDGPAGGGGRNDRGSLAFPTPITIAASRDTALAQQFAEAMGDEQAGKGTNVVLGPMMNMDRMPVGGRNFEGFGEDLLFAAQMAGAIVRGIQSKRASSRRQSTSWATSKRRIE